MRANWAGTAGVSDVFISYARSTSGRAKQVAEALRALGYRAWRDDELPPHRLYADVIAERLDRAGAVLVLWSAEAAKSQWVRSEANRAREEGKLVQARLDAALPPMPFDQIQCADLAGWSGDADAPAWRKVLESIAEMTAPAAKPARPAPKPRRPAPDRNRAPLAPPVGADEAGRPIELAHEAAFELGPLDVHPGARELFAGEAREVLEPKVMQVLVALARRRGDVVSRQDLISAAWGGRAISEDAINRAVGAVRRLAETYGGFAIETIARVGYRLTVEDGFAEPRPPPWRARRWTLALAASALLIAIVAGGWWFLARSPPPAAPARVAVLPFDSPSHSPDADSFADGLMDEILDVLSTDHVQTVSRTEGAALRGSNADAAIARLGVGLLLDGSVATANGSFTVRLHIDDPAQRAVVWSEAFTRPASEADALQAEVAAKVARVLTQALRARASGLSDPSILSDFVTGDEHQRFDLVGGSDTADPFFRRVVARAPNFAGGHAYLAISEAFQSYEPGNPRVAELGADASREAQTAIKLDPTGYDGFLALSLATPITTPNYLRAHEAPLWEGSARDPTDPVYPYFLGRDFALEGRLQAATEAIRRAVSLDSFWPGPTKDLGLYLTEIGQADAGQQIFDHMQRIWPDVWATRSGRLWKEVLYGDPDAAGALVADPRTRPWWVDSRNVEVWRSSLKAVKSDQPEARTAAAAGVKAAANAGQLWPKAAVALLVRLGDFDGAFAVADKFPVSVEYFDLDGPPILFLSQTAPLRRDPRFMRLAAKMSLVGYWRSTGNWPDFCAEPGLPYDCKAEAAKVAGTNS